MDDARIATPDMLQLKGIPWVGEGQTRWGWMLPYEEGGGLDTEPRALCEDVCSGFEVGVTAWAGVLRWEESGSMLSDGRVVEDGPRSSSA